MEGLNHTEIRHLAEKIGEQPEHQVDSEKLAEFSVPSWLVREGKAILGSSEDQSANLRDVQYPFFKQIF